MPTSDKNYSDLQLRTRAKTPTVSDRIPGEQSSPEQLAAAFGTDEIPELTLADVEIVADEKTRTVGPGGYEADPKQAKQTDEATAPLKKDTKKKNEPFDIGDAASGVTAGSDDTKGEKHDDGDGNQMPAEPFQPEKTPSRGSGMEYPSQTQKDVAPASIPEIPPAAGDDSGESPSGSDVDDAGGASAGTAEASVHTADDGYGYAAPDTPPEYDLPEETEAAPQAEEEPVEEATACGTPEPGATEGTMYATSNAKGSFADMLREELAAQKIDASAIQALAGDGVLEVTADQITIPGEDPYAAPAPEPMGAPEPEMLVDAPIVDPSAPAGMGELPGSGCGCDEPATEILEIASTEEDKDTEVVYETLGRIAEMKEIRADQVDLVLTREDTTNPQYVVFVDGDPVAKIALADQAGNLKTDHPDLFTDDEYPMRVLEGINHFGLAGALEHINARPYAGVATTGDVAAAMKEEAMRDLEAEARQLVAEAKQQLTNIATIVMEGSNKNYLLGNPLKDALVANIASLNVPEDVANDLVEAAWASQAGQYFGEVLTKAEEWMGAPDEALQHHVTNITAMRGASPRPVTVASAEQIPAAPRPVTAGVVPQNVPLQTKGGSYQPQQRQASAGTDWSAQKEQFKAEMNLPGRVVANAMTNSSKNNQ